MAGFADFLEELVLDWAFVGAVVTQPSGLHIGLFTTLPADDGTGGTEVSGGSYARQPVTFVRTASAVNPNATVGFPTATADWGTVVGFGVFDAVSGGNLLAFDSVDTPSAVNNTDTASFLASALTITLD